MFGFQAIGERFSRVFFAFVIACGIIAVAAGGASAATLTLPEAIHRALVEAPAIASATAATDLTQAQVRQMKAPFLPAVSAGVEYYQAPGYAQVITNRGLSSALLSADYTAFDFGRRLARLRAARYANEAAMFGVQAARAQIVYDTKVAYYALLHAHQSVSELKSNLQRLKRYVTIIEKLHRTGRVTMNDVLKLRTARDSAELSLASAQNQQRRAAIMLGSLIGDFDRSDFDIAPLPKVPAMPAGEIASSPSLRAAGRAIASAGQKVKAAQDARYPTLKLSLTAGFLGVDPPDTINHNLGASYDGVISVPIFQGGLISSRIDEAKAKEETAVAQKRQAEMLLKRRLSDARAQYDEAHKELSILGRAQPTANGNFALAWTRFLGGGNVSLLEVLSDYQQAEQLRLARFNQTYNLRRSAAEIGLLYGAAQ